MEYLARLFLDKATPTEYESQSVNSDIMLEYLVIRKSKLSMIILLCILELINSIYQLESYETENSKVILSTVVVLNALTISLLIMARVKWNLNTTFHIGLTAFVFDALKLFMLFVPYSYIMSVDYLFQDLIFIFITILPWYVPYFTIMLLFKGNTLYLSKYSSNSLSTWKVLSIIYIPINIFLYGVAINVFSVYLAFVPDIPKSLISILYILWTVGVLELISTYYEKHRIAQILSFAWLFVLLVSLYNLDKGLYIWILQFGITSAINGMKLNMMCKDVLCCIFEIKPNAKKQSTELTHIYSELDSVV